MRMNKHCSCTQKSWLKSTKLGKSAFVTIPTVTPVVILKHKNKTGIKSSLPFTSFYSVPKCNWKILWNHWFGFGFVFL